MEPTRKHSRVALLTSLGGVLSALLASVCCILPILVAVAGVNFSTSTWVNFKLFGGIGLMLVFIMVQAFFLNKHVKADTSPDVSP